MLVCVSSERDRTLPSWYGQLGISQAQQIATLIPKVDPPIPASEEQAVEDILKEAREFYRKKGMISDDEWEVYRHVWRRRAKGFLRKAKLLLGWTL